MALALTIARVDETLFQGDVISATFPGVSGDFTVLQGHEPFVTTLKKGDVIVRKEEGEEVFAITNGLVEVTGERAVVLI